MQRPRLIAALLVGMALVLPAPCSAQLFDGPEPNEAADSAEPPAVDTQPERQQQRPESEGQTRERRNDEVDAVVTQQQHAAKTPDKTTAAPADSEAIVAADYVRVEDGDGLELFQPVAEPGVELLPEPQSVEMFGPDGELLLPETLPGQPPGHLEDDCAACARCRRGCGSCALPAWLCLRDTLLWYSPHRWTHRWLPPLLPRHGKHAFKKLFPKTPMRGSSWLNRPYHADWFFGAFIGDDVVSGELDLDTTYAGGFRFGKDLSDRWGWESRLMFAAPDVTDSTGRLLVETADVVIWDVSAVYYPWGDAVTRPYLTAGLGFAHFDYLDATGRGNTANVLAIPLGGGVQWRMNNWTLLRVEVLNNISLSGSGVSSMNNVTVTGGFEFRCGGRPTSYWPWFPGSYQP